MFTSMLEAINDPNWHVLRDGLVVVIFKTQRHEQDFGPEQLASRLKNRRALGDNWLELGEGAFEVDLAARGIDADQLAAEICEHLDHPGDHCWFLMSTAQGAAFRKIK